METLQNNNRRQKNIKIEVNHLAFDSRNERAITINQPRTNSTPSKMTITSTHKEREEFSPSEDIKTTSIRTKQTSKTDLFNDL